MKKVSISGWGLFPTIEADLERGENRDDLIGYTQGSAHVLAQGNCRSYGDACLAPKVISTLPLQHLLDFDPQRGILRAQAGITLDAIIQFALPRGWFLPVTPGTKFATLGGCIAADVHGKNHHIDGSIGDFVEQIEMVLADGQVVFCSATASSELFWATLGGMGLTGFIYAVTLRLKSVESSYIRVHSLKSNDFAEACQIFKQTHNQYTYSVAWIDCISPKKLGRSIILLGNHASGEEAPRHRFKVHNPGQRVVPCFFPAWVLNPWSIKTFNFLYYHRQLRRRRDHLVHYDPYFYPLDKIGHWNRIYGRRGFLQYQFVVPFEGGQEVMSEILRRIAARGNGSFLAVLKTFGPQEGLLSFPMPGYTLALDFALSDRNLVPFLKQLNQLVLEARGRIYLAKDAILTREEFEPMYPRLEEFKAIKRRVDPEGRFRSLLSDRLGIT